LAFFPLFSPLRRTNVKKTQIFKKHKKTQKRSKNSQKQQKQPIFEKVSFLKI
jgi:hypothetical protein